MDYCPWTQSMPSRDVNAATRLAEASWRRDNMWYMTCLQGCKLLVAHSPMRPNVVCGLQEIKNWSPTWRLEPGGK